jgi:hypothetical protein
VIDSNVYAVPGSSWELKAEPSDGGSTVEMIWAREFRSGPSGRLFRTAFRLVGKRVFGGYARAVLENLERLELDAT